MDLKSDFLFYSLSSQLNSPEWEKSRGEQLEALSPPLTTGHMVAKEAEAFCEGRVWANSGTSGFTLSAPAGGAIRDSSTPPPARLTLLGVPDKSRAEPGQTNPLKAFLFYALKMDRSARRYFKEMNRNEIQTPMMASQGLGSSGQPRSQGSRHPCCCPPPAFSAGTEAEADPASPRTACDTRKAGASSTP